MLVITIYYNALLQYHLQTNYNSITRHCTNMATHRCPSGWRGHHPSGWSLATNLEQIQVCMRCVEEMRLHSDANFRHLPSNRKKQTQNDEDRLFSSVECACRLWYELLSWSSLSSFSPGRSWSWGGAWSPRVSQSLMLIHAILKLYIILVSRLSRRYFRVKEGSVGFPDLFFLLVEAKTLPAGSRGTRIEEGDCPCTVQYVATTGNSSNARICCSILFPLCPSQIWSLHNHSKHCFSCTKKHMHIATLAFCKVLRCTMHNLLLHFESFAESSFSDLRQSLLLCQSGLVHHSGCVLRRHRPLSLGMATKLRLVQHIVQRHFAKHNTKPQAFAMRWPQLLDSGWRRKRNARTLLEELGNFWQVKYFILLLIGSFL